MKRRKAIATAHPNIALIKYWGKADARLNLPAAGSLSATLGPMRTRTELEWKGAAEDTVFLDGEPAKGRDLQRITTFLDMFRALDPSLGGAVVHTGNDFPTASGLASSASGFAALALAAATAAGMEIDQHQLSAIARQGSGSAARSLSGGFVRMYAGAVDTPERAHAKQLHDEQHWPLEAVIVLTTSGRKSVSSTVGMNQTVATSPYFAAWLDSVNASLPLAEEAIAARDFEALTRLAEASAMQMHASAIAADPAVLYWNGTTVDVVHATRQLRDEDGVPVFFSIDAGPHVKLFTLPGYGDKVQAHFDKLPGVRGTLRATIGGDATATLASSDASP